MGTHWESLSCFSSLMLTSGEQYLHVKVFQSVNRRPKCNSLPASDFLCDLGGTLAVYPQDMRRELALLSLQSAPHPIAEAFGVSRHG